MLSGFKVSHLILGQQLELHFSNAVLINQIHKE